MGTISLEDFLHQVKGRLVKAGGNINTCFTIGPDHELLVGCIGSCRSILIHSQCRKDRLLGIRQNAGSNITRLCRCRIYHGRIRLCKLLGTQDKVDAHLLCQGSLEHQLGIDRCAPATFAARHQELAVAQIDTHIIVLAGRSRIRIVHGAEYVAHPEVRCGKEFISSLNFGAAVVATHQHFAVLGIIAAGTGQNGGTTLGTISLEDFLHQVEGRLVKAGGNINACLTISPNCEFLISRCRAHCSILIHSQCGNDRLLGICQNAGSDVTQLTRSNLPIQLIGTNHIVAHVLIGNI